MPLIWCSISGHGFGHAAQVVPVLNELGQWDPDLRVVLRTTVPSTFFAQRLRIPWELQAHQQDIGCVQQDPLTIDVEGTWQAYQDFHHSFERRLETEVAAMRRHNPDLVLSNISYLALEAGRRAGIQSLAYGSLSWDHVLDVLKDASVPMQDRIISEIRELYKRTELVIRIAPSLPLEAFPYHHDVGPISYGFSYDASRIRKEVLGQEKGPLVLVALGGVPLRTLPFERLNRLAPYTFLLDVLLPIQGERLRSTSEGGRSFPELFAAAQIVVSKPGYGTVVEAVAAQKPFVYIRRYNFPDEGPLVEYLHRYGRAVELSKEDFYAGNWQEALDTVRTLPEPRERPPESGVRDAAEMIASYLPQRG